MSHIRSLFFVALTALVGCSAQAASSTDSASADSTGVVTPPTVAADLAKQTIVKGALDIGATTQVAYAPDEYTTTNIDGVPYLAWSIDTTAAPLSVDVNGAFPGAPAVLVTDTAFNVLGKTDGHKLADGTADASLSVDVPAGPKMLLVRDEIWVRPMQFNITVAQ